MPQRPFPAAGQNSTHFPVLCPLSMFGHFYQLRSDRKKKKKKAETPGGEHSSWSHAALLPWGRTPWGLISQGGRGQPTSASEVGNRRWGCSQLCPPQQTTESCRVQDAGNPAHSPVQNQAHLLSPSAPSLTFPLHL